MRVHITKIIGLYCHSSGRNESMAKSYPCTALELENVASMENYRNQNKLLTIHQYTMNANINVALYNTFRI